MTQKIRKATIPERTGLHGGPNVRDASDEPQMPQDEPAFYEHEKWIVLILAIVLALAALSILFR